MNTALTLQQIESNEAHPKADNKETSSVRYLPETGRNNHSNVLPEGNNARRLSLIFDYHADDADVFELMGWSDLPDSLKNVIRTDLEAYRNELLGLYSSCRKETKNRRKSVSYWVNAWRDGVCSEQTAADVLAGLYDPEVFSAAKES